LLQTGRDKIEVFAPFTFRRVGVSPIEFQALPGPEGRATSLLFGRNEKNKSVRGAKLEVRLKKFSKNERIGKNLLPDGRTTSIFSTETQEKKR
jgi:hypothetical protein